MAPVVIDLSSRRRKIFPNDDRATSYWCLLLDQAIIGLEQAVNAPNDRRVKETPQLPNATIGWVPLHNFAVLAAV